MSKDKIDWGYHQYPFKMKSYVTVNGKETEKEPDVILAHKSLQSHA